MTQVRNPAADGVLEPATGGRVVLRFRRKIAHPPERVWAALTEPAELIGWWGAAEVDLAEGGRFVLRWELRPDGGGTLLSFSSTAPLPEEYRALVLAGWHWHLDSLASFIGGTPANLVALPGWDRIHQRYAGPRARTSPFS